MKKIYIENINHECSVPDTKLKFFNYVYAHGLLEDMVGFDLVNLLKKDRFDLRRNYNGEKCLAVLPSGEEVSALLFYWKHAYTYEFTLWWNNQKYRQVVFGHHGLLVAENDEESIMYAQKCFNEHRRDI